MLPVSELLRLSCTKRARESSAGYHAQGNVVSNAFCIRDSGFLLLRGLRWSVRVGLRGDGSFEHAMLPNSRIFAFHFWRRQGNGLLPATLTETPPPTVRATATVITTTALTQARAATTTTSTRSTMTDTPPPTVRATTTTTTTTAQPQARAATTTTRLSLRPSLTKTLPPTVCCTHAVVHFRSFPQDFRQCANV